MVSSTCGHEREYLDDEKVHWSSGPHLKRRAFLEWQSKATKA